MYIGVWGLEKRSWGENNKAGNSQSSSVTRMRLLFTLGPSKSGPEVRSTWVRGMAAAQQGEDYCDTKCMYRTSEPEAEANCFPSVLFRSSSSD